MEDTKKNNGNTVFISPARPETPNHIATCNPLQLVDNVGNTNSTTTTPTAPLKSPFDDMKTPRKSEKPLTEETRKLFLTPEKLASIKRAQLQRYCKRYGIKANLKNTELIKKLQEYALNHQSQQNENDFSSFNIASLSPLPPPSFSMDADSPKISSENIGQAFREILASKDDTSIENDEGKTIASPDKKMSPLNIRTQIENKQSFIPLLSPRISNFMARKIATPIKKPHLNSQNLSSEKTPIYDEESPLIDHPASSNSDIQAINETKRNAPLSEKEETLNTDREVNEDSNLTEQQPAEKDQESYDPSTSTEPFVFNSGMRVDDSTFQTAAAAVLAELERRVAEVQKLPTPEIKKYLGELTPSPKANRSLQPEEASEGLTPSRFDKLHKKNFDKMPSIIKHYAAQRRKAEDESEVSPIKKKKLIHSTNEQDFAKTSQPIYKHEEKSTGKTNESLLHRPSGVNNNRKPKVTSVTRSGITARLATFGFDSRLRKPSNYNIAHASSNKSEAASTPTSISMKQNKELEKRKDVIEKKRSIPNKPQIRNPGSSHQIPVQGITNSGFNSKVKPPPRLDTSKKSSQPKIIDKATSRPFFSRQIYQKTTTSAQQLTQGEVKNELASKIQKKFMKSHKSQTPSFSQKKVNKDKK
ncbi:1042_t:CDS:2 [Ambispora leptoticha]|uniref:1042_t:CDS:1 n=1 Tax=Ambispora leptoticha TaxID=144679 RepID=A0A9N9BAI4_9GLOM|nr:1042_t:CDS:2 [Ambispora leptoticha]